MGSILRFSFPEGGGKSRLVFANPASQTERAHGTVRVSYDEGRTWPLEKLIYDGYYAYSCLTRLNERTIGLLYEKDNYAKIGFAIVGLGWLETSEG